MESDSSCSTASSRRLLIKFSKAEVIYRHGNQITSVPTTNYLYSNFICIFKLFTFVRRDIMNLIVLLVSLSAWKPMVKTNVSRILKER